MKTRKLFLPVIISLISLCVSIPLHAQTNFDDFKNQIEQYRDLKDVPDVKFIKDNGKSFTIKDFEGKVVLINFWASWCGPCIQEMPYLDKLQKELHDEDFTILALNEDFKGRRTAKRFFKRLKIKHLDMYIDEKNRLMNAMGVQSLPHTILVNKKGEIVREYAGFSGPVFRQVVADTKAEIYNSK